VQPEPDAEFHRYAAGVAKLDVPEFVAPAHHQVVLREMRFHYLDWGTPGRQPALFLHGGGQTARTWDLCCLALRSELHCLALDQRGHGDSEWSYAFAYTPEDHAGDVLALLDHLRIERALVVGMSMGCLNGLAFALAHPERVSAFVAVDAGPWVQMEGGQRIVEFTREAAEGVDLDAWVAAAVRFNPRRDPRLLRQGLLHNLRALPDGKLVWKTDRRRWTDLAAMQARIEGLRSRVGAIRCPVLILRGSESDVFSDADAERFAAALPDARWLRVEGAGHTVQGDQPAALVRALREFLADRAPV
jgi:pimeloyl-ACP methyl ester carboxylesterase